MSDRLPQVIVIREIFSALSSGRGDWHHAVQPGDGMVDVVYYENDARKTYISIALDSAEAFAAAVVACANEMRASQQ